MARKLLNASAVDPPPPIFCTPYCDNTKSPDGICPSVCDGLCPPNCMPPETILQIPPPPLSEPQPSPPLAVPHKPHRLSVPLTISLAVLAAAFFLFICYTIYKFYSTWRRNSRRRRSQREDDGGPDDFLDEDHGPVVDHPIWYIRTIGLQPSVISAITIVRYKRGDGLIEGTDCSVCLNEFQDDETLRLLPKCNHAFHIPCIDTWLRSHTNCPLCRAGIMTNAAPPAPSQELAVQDSGPTEENQPEVPGSSNREVRMDSENESPELRIGIGDDGVSRSQSGLKINENLGGGEGNSGLDGVQPMRRSVSVDSLSASMISAAIATAFPGQFHGNSDNQLVEVKESAVEDAAGRAGLNRGLLGFVGSPSIARSMQTAGASSIKRSVSCSAKVFLSRHSSRNRNSVTPQ